MPRRVEHWERDLNEWATGWVGAPFKWGSTDCASMVRQALTVIYGADLYQGRQWRTKAGAIRVARSRGSVAANLDDLGAIELACAFAQQGDIAVAPSDDDSDFHHWTYVVLANGVLVTHPDELIKIVPVGSLPDGSYLMRLPHVW